MSEPLEVVFVGLGYIGLPTAVVMANHGVRVHGVDVNASAVERIQRGEVTIVEPGLEEQLKKAIDSGQLTATTEMQHGDAPGDPPARASGGPAARPRDRTDTSSFH